MPNYQGKIETLFGANVVGYWPLDEASGAVANDISVSNKDLAYSGVLLGQPGIGDGKTCPYFDGVNDSVSSGWAQLSGVLNITEGTLMVWAKPVGGWSAATAGGLVEMTNMGGTNTLMAKGTSTLQYWSNPEIAALKRSYTGWLHIGHTWSATSGLRKTFVDGNPVKDGVAFTTFPSGYPALLRGGCGWNANNWFNGWLAHIVLLNRAATESEMRQAAAVRGGLEADWSGASDYTTLINSTFGANVIGHWPFNETRGYLVHDVSGNAKSAILDQAGILYNQAGIGDGLCSIHVDKTVYASANLNMPIPPPAYDDDEGTIMIWGKNTDAWASSDGFMFYVSNQTGKKFGLKTASNQVGVFTSQGTNIFGAYTGSGWFHAAYTWSKAANETKLFIDGAQAGSTQTCAGGWADPVQIFTFGELQATNPFDGYLAQPVLLNRPATPAEIATVAVVP